MFANRGKATAFVVLSVLLGLATGCGKITGSGGGSESYYRGEYTRIAANYNTLLQQQKALIQSSHALQVAAQKEQRLLLALDVALAKFVTAVEAFYAAVPPDRALKATELDLVMKTLDAIGAARDEALGILADLETNLVAEQTALYGNATHVYEKPDPNREAIAANQKLFRDRGMQLLGVRNCIALTFTQLKRFAPSVKVEGGRAVPPIVVPEKKVELNDRDREVARAVTSTKASGFARDSKGGIVPLSDRAAIVRHATVNGFNGEAAEDAATLAAESGGLVAFASSNADLPKAVVDVVAHIKPQLNTNADDLEIALVIDYSGSMSDKIEATLKGLKEVVESLKNVIQAGRNVRVGLVTFGAPGKEKVELDFTRNMAVVQQELDRLWKEYNTKTHSVDPGEASIHGLEAATTMSWTSKNRMAIAITDEPSYEIRMNQTKYVESVYAKLKKGGIQSRIYTIVVKH